MLWIWTGTAFIPNMISFEQFITELAFSKVTKPIRLNFGSWRQKSTSYTHPTLAWCQRTAVLAGAKGYEDAKKEISEIEGNIMPAQRAEGQRRATEWKPRKP